MKSDQMYLRCKPTLKSDLDSLRKAEPDLPSRAEMIHRLVERATKQLNGKD